MLSRLFALIIIFVSVYLLGVFLLPSFADKYGNASYNKTIREFKSKLEKEPTTSGSIYESIKDSTRAYVDESKSTVDQIQKTVRQKTQEVKNTVTSVQDAYTAMEKAKNDLQKLTIFSTGSSNVSSQ